MPFSEETKLTIKHKAHFSCCLCKTIGIEIHHIISQADGGPDTADNGAPLCPSCHETYGANPTKRKFIREARDFWYEICEKRYAPAPELMSRISDQLQNVATKEDLEKVVSSMAELHKKIVSNDARSVPQRQASLSQAPSLLGGVSMNRHCTKCNSYFGLLVGDQGKCPSCGTPW